MQYLEQNVKNRAAYKTTFSVLDVDLWSIFWSTGNQYMVVERMCDNRSKDVDCKA